MKIYTKTGDAGTTALIGGARIAKNAPRVEAYGTIDELMAHIAVLGDLLAERGAPASYLADLQRIQGELMGCASLLAIDPAAPSAIRAKIQPIPAEALAFLEARIDAMQGALPELRHFTLPGGHIAASMAHVCRTICRRAERNCVAVAGADPSAMAFLNRLSDYLYLLSQALGAHFEAKERVWEPR